jgi:hypothetical protein
MRMLTAAAIAATLMALISWPAQAQMGSGAHHRDVLAPEKKSPVDEKAYKAALDRIPEPKEKYDPWGVARPAEPDKTKPK